MTTLRHTVHAAEIASRQLSLRTNGDHPELLDHGDMSAVVEGFRTSADREGKPHSFTHRRSLLGWWRRLLEFSRRTGAMDDIPGSFALDLRSHTIAQVETSEDDFGRTIPEHVIAQLDQHLELLGRHSTYSAPGWNPDDYAMMYQTVYQIIRTPVDARVRSSGSNAHAWTGSTASPHSSTTTVNVAEWGVDCRSALQRQP